MCIYNPDDQVNSLLSGEFPLGTFIANRFKLEPSQQIVVNNSNIELQKSKWVRALILFTSKEAL